MFKIRLFTGLLLFFLILTYSCTAVKKAEEVPFSKVEFRKSELKNIILSGNISSVISGQSVSAYCKMILVGTDSASMTLYGPMGMLVARLYAKPDYFVFYNTITSEGFEGKPTKENLQKILNVPLNFIEFARLVRNEMTDNPENFLQLSNKLENDKIVYKNTANKDYAEFCLFSADLKSLEQYQRKGKDGSMLLNFIYQNFETVLNYSLPRKFIFKFPLMDGSVVFEADNVEINQIIDKPFNISVPKSYRKYTLD